MYADIRRYLEWKATYTQKAPDSYKLHLIRFAEYCGKATEHVHLDDIVGFINHHKKKYSLSHTYYVSVIIKNFFEYIKRQGRTCLDPYLIRPPKYTSHSHTPVTLEDFKAISRCLSESDFHQLTMKVAIHLLWDTGMRVSELCDMQINDVSDTMSTQIVTRKNKQLRWIFWSRDTHRLLETYLVARLQLGSEPHLFHPTKGKASNRITPRSIQRWVKEVANKAGVNKKLSPHSFRHGRAHHIVNNGGGIVEVQKVLGHSETNPQASFHYLRMNQHEASEIARRYL